MSCFCACFCQRTRCRAATERKCKKAHKTRGNKLQETRRGLFTPTCSVLKQRFACKQRVVDLPSTSQELPMSDPLLRLQRLMNESCSPPLGHQEGRQTDDKSQRCWFPAKAPTAGLHLPPRADVPRQKGKPSLPPNAPPGHTHTP